MWAWASETSPAGRALSRLYLHDKGLMALPRSSSCGLSLQRFILSLWDKLAAYLDSRQTVCRFKKYNFSRTFFFPSFFHLFFFFYTEDWRGKESKWTEVSAERTRVEGAEVRRNKLKWWIEFVCNSVLFIKDKFKWKTFLPRQGEKKEHFLVHYVC